MYKDLLPIGSVVLLSGGTKRLMITSRVVSPGDSKDIYDYSGCLYPEGILDIESVYFFNRDAIARVYFIGFQDEEELQYRAEVFDALGDLYVNDDGQIVERERAEDESEETTPSDEPVDAPAEEIEAPVFADV